MSEDNQKNSIFSEKRQYRRFPSNVLVKYRMLDVHDAPNLSAAGQFRDGKTKNFSTTGLFVAAQEAPPRGTLLEVSFGVHRDREIKVVGKVAWISTVPGNIGFGVEVYKTSEEQLAEIISRAKRGEWVEVDLENERGKP